MYECIKGISHPRTCLSRQIGEAEVWHPPIRNPGARRGWVITITFWPIYRRVYKYTLRCNSLHNSNQRKRTTSCWVSSRPICTWRQHNSTLCSGDKWTATRGILTYVFLKCNVSQLAVFVENFLFYDNSKGKGKAIPLQARCGPEGG